MILIFWGRIRLPRIYGLSLTTDDDFLFMQAGTYLRTGIRFYYDENDRVIMIQYYEEHSANGV